MSRRGRRRVGRPRTAASVLLLAALVLTGCPAADRGAPAAGSPTAEPTPGPTPGPSPGPSPGPPTGALEELPGGPPAGLPGDLPPGPPPGWRLSWEDDFTGTALDTAAWRAHRYSPQAGDQPFNPSLEDAWFSPDNVRVADGLLQIEMRPEPRTLGGRTYPHSSGVVMARTARSVTPDAYVEARIRVPTCRGCWPAFWALPAGRWPPEIDVVEFFDTAEQTRPAFAYHQPDGGRSGPVEYGDAGTDHREGFHVYGALWTPSAVVPYLDGVPHPEAAATREVTSLPLGLVLNLSLEAGGSPGERAVMAVDWVRVWRPPAG